MLAKAQAELAPAVLSGADSDAVRARAQAAQTKIDALDSTAAILAKEADRLDVERKRLGGPGNPAAIAVLSDRVSVQFPYEPASAAIIVLNYLFLLVGRLGLEPRTKALKGPCSTS